MQFKKFPARYFGLVFPFVISIFMSCMVSGIATYHSIGMTDTFVESWMAAWGFSWVIAFPILLLVIPVARRIVFVFVEQP